MPNLKANKNHICRHCGAKFSRSHQLKQHMKPEVSNKKYKCEKCSATFRNLDCLVVHSKVHSESYCKEVKEIRHQEQLVVNLPLNDEKGENHISDETDDFNLIEFLLSDTYKYLGNDEEVLKLINPTGESTVQLCDDNFEFGTAE